jgi:hypothetical protein
MMPTADALAVQEEEEEEAVQEWQCRVHMMRHWQVPKQQTPGKSRPGVSSKSTAMTWYSRTLKMTEGCAQILYKMHRK